MRDANDHDKILDKIKKCLALSSSSNEHEAAIALRQAQTQALLAREYFNLLRYAPNNAAVDLPQEDLSPNSIQRLLNQLNPSEQSDSPAPALTRLERSLAAQRAQVEASRALKAQPTTAQPAITRYSTMDIQAAGTWMKMMR